MLTMILLMETIGKPMKPGANVSKERPTDPAANVSEDRNVDGTCQTTRSEEDPKDDRLRGYEELIIHRQVHSFICR